MSNVPISRRRFLATTVTASAASWTLPTVWASDKAESRPIVIGTDDHRFEVEHDFLKLPDRFSWQTTHNVAVDRQQNIYVIHEGNPRLKEHPAIFVFDNNGEYIRSFASDFQGGGHGLEVRAEGSEDFLYVTGYKRLKKIAKLTTQGETVWERRAPMESGLYAAGEDQDRSGTWGRDRFLPTNFAFLRDGGFLLADGYGAYAIHRYDNEANYLGTFGRPGTETGEFQLPHGLWVDDRGDVEEIIVADRVNARLQGFSLAGEHRWTLEGFILPANVDIRGELTLVPDLSARITLINRDRQVVAQLGDDSDWREKVMQQGFPLRSQPTAWRGGRFLHPHDACFDHEGHILVAEWVATGRVTRLRRLS